MEDEALKDGANAPDNSETDLDAEIDNILKDTPADNEDGGDEEVIVKKSEYEKVKRDNENYKKGLISVKDKFKVLTGKNAKAVPKPDDKEDSEDKPLTHKDLYLINTNKALEGLQQQDPIIADNWEKISKYYRPIHGKATPEAVAKDIKQAKLLFLDDNPEVAEKYDNDSDKESEAEISAIKSKPAGKSDNAAKPKEKKTIIPKRTSVQNWYD